MIWASRRAVKQPWGDEHAVVTKRRRCSATVQPLNWAQLTLKGRRSKLQIQAGSIDAGLTCRALRGGFFWTLANEGLFDFLLPSYDSTSTDLLLKGYFLIFGPLSVNPRDGYVGNSQQCLSATNNSQCLPPLIPGVAAMWLADITLVLTGSSIDIITKVAQCIMHTYTAYETDKNLSPRTWQDRLFFSFILINWVKDVETETHICCKMIKNVLLFLRFGPKSVKSGNSWLWLKCFCLGIRFFSFF